jgi:4-hydroxy-tetrahydrodipicolinate synthase
MMGKIDPELRLPLCAMATETKDQLAKALKDAGII